MLTHGSSALLQIGRRAPRGPELIDEVEAARWQGLVPSFAHIYAVNKCHLRCEHCYESEATHPPDEQLSTDELKRVLDELAALGVLVVTFSGGEPFLRRDLLELVEHARRRRFVVRLYTTGTHIDAARADRLAALGASEVHISVYSHDAAAHDRFTGVPGSHERSLRAIRLLVERGVKTTMKVTVLKLNVDHLYDVVALARRLGTKMEIGTDVYARVSGERAPREHAVSPDELRAKVLAHAELSSLVARSSAEGVCEGEGGRSLESTLCAVARRIITIGADGGVYGCAMFPTSAGSVRHSSIRDIWRRSALFDRLRKTTFGSMQSCSSCDVKTTCSPCMAFGVVERGDHHACNSTSRDAAVARRAVLERRLRAERRMAKGRALPIVDEKAAPPGDGTVIFPQPIL